jgi:hypothetical protein
MGAQPRPLDETWVERERYWRRRLGRIRLGVEPVKIQLQRYRRVTLVLTAIPTAMAAVFVTLFWAFGRPDIGAVLVLVVLAPIILIAWLDFARLARRVDAYLREREAFAPGSKRNDPAGTGSFPPGLG